MRLTKSVKKPSKPLEYALKLLSQRSYSEKKLTEKLISREVDPAEIATVIAKLKEYGYVNDVKYAKDYVESAQNIKLSGPRKIYWQLIKKGISKETAKDAIDQTYNNDNEPERIGEIIKKYARNIPREKLYERLMRRLIARGYDYTLVKKEVHDFINSL